ncbi:hypothetical protein [Actinophytocola sp.]|uniref:hypothetical protein n=1 Tax=Actinophytocola sp. TaxID=1872138 RepID=UPI002ED27657
MDAVWISASVALVGIGVGVLTTWQSNRRLRQEHHDEQARLKLDAAMRAGELFSAKDQASADPAAIASGLLALTRLDHADLAVALLVDLWSNGDEIADRSDHRVAHETAVLVIDAALRSTTKPNAQLVAAELLCRNAHRLNSCQSLHWPSVIDGGWDQRFGPKTKLLLLDALIVMTLARPVSEDALRSVAVRLYGVWRDDQDSRVRGCVGRLVGAVVPALKHLGYADFMQGNHKVLLTELEIAAASGTNNPDGFLDRIVDDRCKRLATWASSCQQAEPADARLAAAI